MTPAIERRVREWHVLTAIETLSAHVYVAMTMDGPNVGTNETRTTGTTRCKWSLRRMNPEALTEAIQTALWAKGSRGEEDAESEARWMDRALRTASDASMPRMRTANGSGKRSVYWWTADIARARKIANAARRALLRARRRLRGRPDTAETEALRRAYKEAKSALKAGIKKAKRAGASCCARSRSVGATADECTTNNGEHAEGGAGSDAGRAVPAAEGDGRRRRREAQGKRLDVGRLSAVREVKNAVARMTRKRTAPGPDVIHGEVLAAAMPSLEPAMRVLLDKCLRDGVFPGAKEANLVLIPKPGRRGKYHPICLLGETGKLLERIVSNRITRHMERVGPDLSANQFVSGGNVPL